MNHELAFRIVAVTPWLLVLCAYDIRERRLPNGWTLGGLAAALVYCLAFGGVELFASSLLAGLLAGLFLLIPFFLRSAGGGDLKMLAAAGVVVGIKEVVNLLFFVSISGFVLAVVLWCAGKVDASRLKHYFRVCFDWRYDRAAGRKSLPPRSSEKCRVPFGVAIAAGVWITLLLNLYNGGTP